MPSLSLLLSAAAAAVAAAAAADDDLPAVISNLPALVAACEATTCSIGFVSEANYDSVRHLLPDNTADGGHVDVQIMPHVADIEAAVINGTLDAGLVSGEPEDEGGLLTTFSSTAISPRASFMAPCGGGDGGAADPSDLEDAVNAAWARVVDTGAHLQAHLDNAPFESVASFTCSPTPSHHPFPDAAAATGSLRDVLDTGVLKVAALGRYDWGIDGNYTKDTPTGFWPDYLQALVKEMSKGLGRDIAVERTYAPGSAGVLGMVLDGSAHLTEPYYVTGASYGEPARPRTTVFTTTCTVLGYDSTFFTLNHVAVQAKAEAEKLKNAPPPPSDGGDGLSTGAIVGIAVAAAVAVALAGVLIFMITREKQGSPLFTPLTKDGEPAAEA